MTLRRHRVVPVVSTRRKALTGLLVALAAALTPAAPAFAETDPPDDGGPKPAVWGDDPSQFTPHIVAYAVGAATFGAPLTTTPVTGRPVRAFDAVGDGSDACEPVENASSVSGSIALVRRGNCAFVQKARNAQDAGAIAVVVVNTGDVGGAPPLGGADPTIVIPAVSIRPRDEEELHSLSTIIPGSTWHVGLLDTTWPALFRVTDQRYDATGPSGRVIPNFRTMFVTDDLEFPSASSIACAPAGGSTFAIGDTPVTCTATDSDGNTGSISFTVHVKGAGEQIDDLIDIVVDQLSLPQAVADSLRTRLKAAAQAVLARDTRLACLGLQRFRSLVQAAAAANAISNEDAAFFINYANRIRAVLAC
jgi:PA domain/HYR domain